MRLPKGRYRAILADPPWWFRTWSARGRGRCADRHYRSAMTLEQIKALPVHEVAERNCILFLWATWPNLLDALEVIEAWGFTYKTCAFDFIKLTKSGRALSIGCGYWTRANAEPCLLATRGHPKRRRTDVRQVILEPRREHSRKPDCIHDRIEQLVAGPYLELFARKRRRGWTSWGNEVAKWG